MHSMEVFSIIPCNNTSPTLLRSSESCQRFKRKVTRFKECILGSKLANSNIPCKWILLKEKSSFSICEVGSICKVVMRWWSSRRMCCKDNVFNRFCGFRRSCIIGPLLPGSPTDRSARSLRRKRVSVSWLRYSSCNWIELVMPAKSSCALATNGRQKERCLSWSLYWIMSPNDAQSKGDSSTLWCICRVSTSKWSTCMASLQKDRNYRGRSVDVQPQGSMAVIAHKKDWTCDGHKVGRLKVLACSGNYQCPPKSTWTPHPR